MKGLVGSFSVSEKGLRAARLQNDETQTIDSARPDRGCGRRPSIFPEPGVNTGIIPAPPVVVQASDPDLKAKRERAAAAVTAAALQRAFDAWLDLRTRRQDLLSAAASLWVLGTLRCVWTRWEAHHQRMASRLERADYHAAVTVSRRATSVRAQTPERARYWQATTSTNVSADAPCNGS